MAYETFDEAERAAINNGPSAEELYAVRLMDGWHLMTAKQRRSDSTFRRAAFLPVGITVQRCFAAS